jgi:peptide/nickel transport system permease protein
MNKERIVDSFFYKTFCRLLKRKLAIVGMGICIIVVFFALFGDYVMPFDPNKNVLQEKFQSPSLKHLMGTDELGRDVLSRIIYGCRIAMEVGIVAVSIAFAFGTVLGLTAGFYGGKVDLLISNIVDAIWSFPTLIFALAITTLLGTGLVNVMIAIGIVFTPGFARIVRSMVLMVKSNEYIESAISIGLSNGRIIRRYIFPNVFSVIIVQASLNAAQAIIAEATLSYLGLGVQLPNSSWGSMLKYGYSYIAAAPWLSIFPGIAITLLVLGLNFLGDGLRDALDVKINEE